MFAITEETMEVKTHGLAHFKKMTNWMDIVVIAVMKLKILPPLLKSNIKIIFYTYSPNRYRPFRLHSMFTWPSWLRQSWRLYWRNHSSTRTFQALLKCEPYISSLQSHTWKKLDSLIAYNSRDFFPGTNTCRLLQRSTSMVLGPSCSSICPSTRPWANWMELWRPQPKTFPDSSSCLSLFSWPLFNWDIFYLESK